MDQPCSVCGGPVLAEPPPSVDPSRRWYHSLWFFATAGVAAVIVLVVGVLAFAATRDTSSPNAARSASSNAVAMQNWWAGAREDFEELESASDDLRQAIAELDRPGLSAGCQDIHDSAEVRLKAHLPTPDPDLTAEIAAAIEDFHDAVHLCMAVVAGSVNNHDGEFLAFITEADRHFRAARELITETLKEA